MDATSGYVYYAVMRTVCLKGVVAFGECCVKKKENNLVENKSSIFVAGQFRKDSNNNN